MWSFKNATIRKQTKQNILSGQSEWRDDVLPGLREYSEDTADRDKASKKNEISTSLEPTPTPKPKPKHESVEKKDSKKQKITDPKDAGRHGDLKWRKK